MDGDLAKNLTMIVQNLNIFNKEVMILMKLDLILK
jgi:hypothetical protein